MFYWITNGSAIVVTLILFIICLAIEKFNFKRFTVKTIAIIGVLTSLSVVLTNVVGYSRIFGFQIMIGNFVIFLAGMSFGPLVGLVTGVVSDSVGALVNISGMYHVGFMLAKVLFGISGAMVFIWKTNRFWTLKLIGFMTLAISVSLFLINPISLWSMGFVKGYVLVDFIRKLITFPIELTLYSFLTIISFRVVWILIKDSSEYEKNTWVGRNGDIRFLLKPKKTMYESLSKKQKAKYQEFENQQNND